MGEPARVLLVMAVFSRHDEAFQFAREQATADWGPIAAKGPIVDFVETDYYEPSMGSGLRKTLWAFDRLIEPGRLPELKLQANAWEDDYARRGAHPEERPLNLDPGYLTLAKFVLASTKDHAHRLYLADGVYGEVTLHYHKGGWQPWPWTYPDYRRTEHQQFLMDCRQLLQQRLARNDEERSLD